MGEIFIIGFKFLFVYKKLDLELERNIKKIDCEVMKWWYILYVEIEGVWRDMYKMFYDVKDIDIIFGLEFMDDIVRKMFLFLWKSFVID